MVTLGSLISLQVDTVVTPSSSKSLGVIAANCSPSASTNSSPSASSALILETLGNKHMKKREHTTIEKPIAPKAIANPNF